ncbi:MAG: hypothetical protein IJC24_07100 [Clostridia bacterium]|nr:hypothetical protein [Clostridia bacterium]
MAVAKKYGQIQELRSSIPLSDNVLRCKADVAKSPTDPALWYKLGLAYAEQDLYLEAEEAMSEAVSYQAFYTDAYLAKGDYQMRIGRYDEAAADLSMAAHLNPESAKAWKLYGIALFLCGEYARACRALEVAYVKCSCSEVSLWYSLALLKAGNAAKSKDVAATVADCKACAVLSGALSAAEAAETAKGLDDSARCALAYTAAEVTAASGDAAGADALLKSVVDCLDTCWYGYFEHAVRVALRMDAAVRCVF